MLCVFVIILNGLHSDKTQEVRLLKSFSVSRYSTETDRHHSSIYQRYLHIACPLVITVVANILAVATTKTAPRYVAMMLMPASFYARWVSDVGIRFSRSVY